MIHVKKSNFVEMLMAGLKKYTVLFVGTFLVGVGISLFQLPNKIVTGGVGGIATLLYYIFHAPPGLTIIIVNMILLFISLKALGKEFVMNTVISVVLLSVFVQILSLFPPITKNGLLASMFGGAIYGLGIGITLAHSSTTGGTDIVARLLQLKLPFLPIGKMLLAVDGTIILASLFVFKTMELAMMGIISVLISTFVVDRLHKTLNYSKMIFVVSRQYEEIAKHLIATSPRGVTLVEVRGGFSFEKKGMLFCLLKSSEIIEFQKKVLSFDSSAFMVISSSEQIVGNGFRIYT